MTPNRECKRCVLPSQNGGVCPVFSGDMSAEAGCPLFASALNPCDICGAHIAATVIIEQDEEVVHQMCPQCAQKHDCEKCINTQTCSFQTDRSCPEPPVITIQQRQGNAVVQMQQPNPKRIELTCAKGCPCYTGLEFGIHCAKQLSLGCEKYKTNWRK